MSNPKVNPQLKAGDAARSAPVPAAPYTHFVSRSSAGFQPVYPENFRGWSPISNRHGWRRFWARGKARKTSRLEALRYSRLETCATACGRSKMRGRCSVPGRSNVEMSIQPENTRALARSVVAAPGDGRTPPPKTEPLHPESAVLILIMAPGTPPGEGTRPTTSAKSPLCRPGALTRLLAGLIMRIADVRRRNSIGDRNPPPHVGGYVFRIRPEGAPAAFAAPRSMLRPE